MKSAGYPSRIFDSTKGREFTSSISIKSSNGSVATGTGSFLIPARQPVELVDDRSMCDSQVTSVGDYFSIQSQIEKRPTSVNMDATREENSFDVALNEVRRIYKGSNTRERPDTPCMNHILAKGFGVVTKKSLYDRILDKEVEGGNISDAPRIMSTIRPAGHLAYEWEKWFTGPYGDKMRNVYFSTAKKKAKSHEEERERKLTPMTKEECEELERLEQLRKPSKTGRVPKWSIFPRNLGSVGKIPGYQRAGVQLPPDYDRMLVRQYPAKFNQAKRDLGKRLPMATDGIHRIYDTDTGPKASTGVQVKQSHITYRSAFSARPSYDIGKSTSGAGGGPGSYVPKPACEVKDPHKKSYFAIRNYYDPAKAPPPQSAQQFQHFGEGSKGFIFPKSGGRSPSWIRQEAVKEMVSTMYPPMGWRQFGMSDWRKEEWNSPDRTYSPPPSIRSVPVSPSAGMGMGMGINGFGQDTGGYAFFNEGPGLGAVQEGDYEARGRTGAYSPGNSTRGGSPGGNSIGSLGSLGSGRSGSPRTKSRETMRVQPLDYPRSPPSTRDKTLRSGI